jgi:scyllo-inositol 2-dehydrogenase (NADP+)
MKQSNMTMKKIKTGLAAFGMSGQVFHAPFISTNPNFEFTAVCERTKNLAKEHYPEVMTVRSVDELLAIKDLELIVVNTPHFTHYEYARKALEAGKNVIVEKPFTKTVEEGKELIELADSKGLMLCVYQNRRWDADFFTVKQIIENNVLGRLVEYESTLARYRNFIRPNTWKETEGSLTYDLGPHLIDQCVCLFGIPEAVYADIAVNRTDGKVDDYFIIHLLHCQKYPDVHITLKSSYLMCNPEPRFVLHGTDGSYVKYSVDRQEEMLKKGLLPNTPDWGVEYEKDWGILTKEEGGNIISQKYPSLRGSYANFYNAVYEHLRCGKKIETSACNVLPVINIIEAAMKSSLQKQVVCLNAN